MHQVNYQKRKKLKKRQEKEVRQRKERITRLITINQVKLTITVSYFLHLNLFIVFE